MLKKTLISTVMLGVVAFALASSGGGKGKKAPAVNSGFASISTPAGFTLKSGPKYTGSSLLLTQKSKNFTLYNTLVTYQKGNTIYILPYKYKMQTKSCFKSNLKLVDLKLNITR